MKNDPHVTEMSDDGALLKRYRYEIVDLKRRLLEASVIPPEPHPQIMFCKFHYSNRTRSQGYLGGKIPDEPSDEMEISQSAVTVRSFKDSLKDFVSPEWMCELSGKISNLELQRVNKRGGCGKS
ncbi:hypothetical protein Q5P01_000405 [Channa striata]|uniref:Uncharacterized protein n=1 Tax=Channa striata TaxID=64152 RepID=A0AA88LLT9_CHASR|nr:hypothetical protein Q5P01_000405 [Channa striata]